MRRVTWKLSAPHCLVLQGWHCWALLQLGAAGLLLTAVVEGPADCACDLALYAL